MSKRVQHYFTQYQSTKQVLITIGQTTHNITTRMQIWSAGFKVKSIPELEKEVAMKQGSEFIGEFFIFSVAGSLVVWEYDKSKKKEVKKEEDMNRKIVDIKDGIEKRVDCLQVKIEKLEETIAMINNNIKHQNLGIQHDNGAVFKRRRGWLW
jgi:uncharacterized Rmd1/YagE family protein